MDFETRICQNCQKDFTIEPDDFSFYEKIKVPPPTWCPECRLIRRMNWRNERNLYKKKNEASEKREKILSMYSSNSPYVIYDKEYWWSDEWDPFSYGREYNFQKSFFEQFDELLKNIKEAEAFFRDLLTLQEIKTFTKRFQQAKLLPPQLMLHL